MSNAILESPRGPVVVPLDDKLLDERNLFLTSEVNTDSMTSLIKQVKYLTGDSREDKDKEITLYINSPGGDVTSGLALYDCLVASQAPIKTVCIGIAASMAAILFLASDNRTMLPHTRLMIHDPAFLNTSGFSGKKPHELQQEVDNLNRVKETLAEIIAEKTGKTLEEICEVTANDTYFSAQEALEFGLATEISTKGV